MQATSQVAPARAAVKRFTNKILFLSCLIKTQFVQGDPGGLATDAIRRDRMKSSRVPRSLNRY